MYSSFQPFSHSKDPASIGYPHNEKETVVAAETVDVGLKSLDLNPGELTFEEGQSLCCSAPSRNLSDV